MVYVVFQKGTGIVLCFLHAESLSDAINVAGRMFSSFNHEVKEI